MEVFSRGEQCDTWEEDMYWKYFHAFHFYLILPTDFHDHLVLPSKFTEHVSSKIPNKVSLTGPSGATWDVEVSKTDSLALTGDGWKHFTKAYNMEENFLVLFQYEQNSSFKVLIFDQKNSCEIESSYFVKKCFPTGGKRKRGVGEEASTEIMEDTDDSSEDVASKRPKKGASKKGPKKNSEDPRESPSSEDNCDDPESFQSDKAIDDIVVEVINSVSNEVTAQNGRGSNHATEFTVQSNMAAMGRTYTYTAGNPRQPNEKEQIPTKTGEKVSEKVILSANGTVFSDTSSAEVMNKDVPSGRRNPSRQSCDKRGRTTTKRALPISARSFMFKAGASKEGRKKKLEDPRESPSSEDNCDDPEFFQSDKAIDDIGVEVINSVSNEVAAQHGGGSTNVTKFTVHSKMGPSVTNAAGNLCQPNEKAHSATKVGKNASEKEILSAGDNGKVFSDTSSVEVMNKDIPSGRRNPSRESRGKRGKATTKRALPISARSFMFKSGASKQGHKKNPEDPRISPSSEDECDDPQFIQSDKAIDDIVVKVINSVSNEVAAQNGGGSTNVTKFTVHSNMAATGPSDTNAAGNPSQPNEKEHIPPKTGEKMSEKVILSAGDNGSVFSDTSSVEVTNKDVPSGRRNPSRESRGKRGRATTKRALPICAKSLMFKSGVKRLWKEYMSHRRPVTDREIANAVRRANEAFTEGSFIVIMRPTIVYKNFYLKIPSDWMHKNLPRRYQEVTLRVGEKSWVTTLHFDKRRVASGELRTGWKDFAIENNLEECDVCLFKPANLKDDDSTFILDVKIFRVVEEVIPLMPVV